MSSASSSNARPRRVLHGTAPAPSSRRMRNAGRRRSVAARGFTLVELLAVVAMIGILAALALVGYRKYMNSAGSAEAAAMIQGFRAAEETYKSEMLVYLGCSGCASADGCAPGAGSLTAYYPMANPDSRKHAWINEGHSDFPCWRRLNVVSDGPVRFGYSIVAGAPNTTPMSVVGFASPPVWPVVTQPWYVIQARGDRDEDGVPALFLASSLQGEIYSENDTE